MSDTRTCRCSKPIRRRGNRGPWPSQCDDCKSGRARSPSSGRRTVAATATEADATDVPAELSAHDVIEQFNLDYNLGNAVRFILERADDAGELANLETAQTYLTRAITRLSASAAPND